MRWQLLLNRMSAGAGEVYIKQVVDTRDSFRLHKKPMASSAQSIETSLSYTDTPESQVRTKTYPFRRFYARSTDLVLLGFLPGNIILYGLGYNFPQLAQLNYLSLLAMSIAVIFGTAGILGALCIAISSTTPAKAVFGIKLLCGDRKLNFSNALAREVLVFGKGLSFGIPILCLITMVMQHVTLKRDGKTTWDRDCDVEVVHSKWGIFRPLFATLLTFAALFVYSIVSTVLNMAVN